MGTPIMLAFEEVIAVLESRAAARESIFYNDLATQLGLPPVNNLFSNHPLKLFFEQIDADDAEEQRPFRTAVVVQKETRRPGGGFYRSLELFRGLTISSEMEAHVWSQEFQELADYYAPGSKKSALQIELSCAQHRRLDLLSERYKRTPKDLIERTFSNLLAYLEREITAIEEADAQIERGEFHTNEEVVAMIENRFRKK